MSYKPFVAQANVSFGFSLELSGNLLLVGAPGYDDAGGNDHGFVRLYQRSAAGVWNGVASLPGGPASCQAGRSVALSGNWVAFNDCLGSVSTRVVKTARWNGSWSPQANVPAPANSSGSFGFGAQSIRILKGASGALAIYDPSYQNGTWVGAVMLYRGTYAGWSTPEVASQPPLPTSGNSFGQGLAIGSVEPMGLILAGTEWPVVVMGDPGYDINNQSELDVGALYVYMSPHSLNSSTVTNGWGTGYGPFLVNSPFRGENFGRSLDMDDATILAGTRQQISGQPQAHLFDFSLDYQLSPPPFVLPSWTPELTETAIFLPSDDAPFARDFSHSVAVTGFESGAVGAPVWCRCLAQQQINSNFQTVAEVWIINIYR